MPASSQRLSFTKLASTLAPFLLFYIAYLIDHKLESIAMYPIYLPSILWLSSRWSWPIGIVSAAIASALSTPMSSQLPWRYNQIYIDHFLTRFTLLALLSIFYSNYIGLARSHQKRHNHLKTLIRQCPDCGSILCLDGQWRSLDQLNSHPEEFGKTPKHECNELKPTSQP